MAVPPTTQPRLVACSRRFIDPDFWKPLAHQKIIPTKPRPGKNPGQLRPKHHVDNHRFAGPDGCFKGDTDYRPVVCIRVVGLNKPGFIGQVFGRTIAVIVG